MSNFLHDFSSFIVQLVTLLVQVLNGGQSVLIVRFQGELGVGDLEGGLVRWAVRR